MNSKDQLEIVKLAEKLISKAINEGAYDNIVMPNAPHACLSMLNKLKAALQANIEIQNTPMVYEIEITQ